MIWWFVGGAFFGAIVAVLAIGLTSMGKDEDP